MKAPALPAGKITPDQRGQSSLKEPRGSIRRPDTCLAPDSQRFSHTLFAESRSRSGEHPIKLILRSREGGGGAC